MSRGEKWYQVCQIGATKVSVLSPDQKQVSGVSFVSERKGCAVFFDSVYKAHEFLASLEDIKIGINHYIKAQYDKPKVLKGEDE